ncbi:hypothetical protein [Methyloglobulus sp.]|uniref:hypothetical protein n=1 Tax=Methyloglobulus sp. TaxID=2518622 RepID=UPI0032B7B270
MTDRDELEALILNLEKKGYSLIISHESGTGHIGTIKVNDNQPLHPIAFAEKYRPIAKLSVDFRKELQAIRHQITIIHEAKTGVYRSTFDTLKEYKSICEGLSGFNVNIDFI